MRIRGVFIPVQCGIGGVLFRSDAVNPADGCAQKISILHPSRRSTANRQGPGLLGRQRDLAWSGSRHPATMCPIWVWGGRYLLVGSRLFPPSGPEGLAGERHSGSRRCLRAVCHTTEVPPRVADAEARPLLRRRAASRTTFSHAARASRAGCAVTLGPPLESVT